MARWNGRRDMRARGTVVAGVLAGVLWLAPALAGADTAGGEPVPPPAPAASPAKPPRASPHAIAAARRHAQAGSGTAHAPSVPPTMRRTRNAVGQKPRW